MTEATTPSRPPLGSWPRFYALVCVTASFYIVLLYWFTATFNRPEVGS